MKHWIMILVLLGFCVFPAHAGFKMYAPGQEQPSIVVRGSEAEGMDSSDVRRVGSLAEFGQGQYAVTFTAENGKQGVVRILDHTGKEVGAVQSGPHGGYAAGSFFIQRPGWYTISAAACSNLKFRKGNPPSAPVPESTQPRTIRTSGLGPAMTRAWIKAGQYASTVTHDGRSNCIIHAHLLGDDATGLDTYFLSNLVGVDTSQKYVHVRKSGEYVLEAKADGQWTLDLTPLAPGQPMPAAPAMPVARNHIPSSPALPAANPVWEKCPPVDMSGVEWSRMRGSYDGRGQQSTRPLGFKAGAYHVEYQYRGGDNFIVWMRTRRGQRELVANRIGTCKGLFAVDLKCDDEVWFLVETKGNWRLTFEKE